MEPDPFRYHTAIDVGDDNNSHALLLRLAGAGKRVLDVGCATGELGGLLRGRNSFVAGIEKDEALAAVASTKLDRVEVADIESADLEALFDDASFDVIVFGDVLEHLTDPQATLRRFRPLLAPRGTIVASIPNVAHGSVRLKLLAGDFTYTDVGLLDRTHLRFFTRDSVHELFEGAGFAVVEVRETTIDPLLAPDGPPPTDALGPEVVERVRAEPDALVYQFVVKAVADDAERSVRALRERATALEKELAGIHRGAPVVHQPGAAGRPVRAAIVADALRSPRAAWSAEILRFEIERRRADVSLVATVVPAGSPMVAPWADAVLAFTSTSGPATPYGITPVDASASRLLATSSDARGTDAEDPAFGLALLTARLLKTYDDAARLPLLRLVGDLPSSGDYVFAAVSSDVTDREGIVRVAARAADATGALVVLPDSAETGIGFDALRADIEVHEMSTDAPLADVLTAVATASKVITTDPIIAAMALATRRSHALLTGPSAEAAVVASTSGGHATEVSGIDEALFRSEPSPNIERRLALLQAAVDEILDGVAEAAIAPRADQLPDDRYVRHLESVISSLQQKLARERVAVARALEDEGFIASAATGAGSKDDVRALQRVVDAHRSSIACLQEALFEAQQLQQAVPAVVRRPWHRRVAGRLLRQLHLRP